MRKLKKRLNEKGGAVLITIVIILVAFMIIGGGATVYYSFKDQKVEFPQEVVDEANVVAQEELDKAYEVTEKYTFDERFEGIQSIGYGEPEEGEYAIYTFEKQYDDKDDVDYYILLKLKPHEQYEHLSRVIISVFDKEKGALITQKENILTWKTELDK